MMGATGAEEARRQAAERSGYAAEFELATYFLPDVPQSVLRAGAKRPLGSRSMGLALPTS
jgi:hypothetical protein